MEDTSKEQYMSDTERNRIVESEFIPQLDALYNFAYHLTYNDTDAEDLVQETMLKACRSVESYQLGTNAKAWLFTILRHVFINDYRKKSKMPQRGSIEDIEKHHHAQEGTKGKHLDLSHEAFRDMMGDEVLAAIESLSEEFKTIILLDLEDFKYAEMAEIINIPVGTVRSRLFRARKELKKKLRDYADHMGYDDQEDAEPVE